MWEEDGCGEVVGVVEVLRAERAGEKGGSEGGRAGDVCGGDTEAGEGGEFVCVGL